MKKIILVAITATCMIHVQAQVPPQKKENTVNRNIRPADERRLNNGTMLNAGQQSSCCGANPNVLTACAESLLQSFKNLTGGTGVHNCHPTLNYPSVSYAMPENCFSFQSSSASMVTFTSFYVPATNIFRVIWGGVPGNFSYYGACAPDPIIFPHPGKTENHVFEARLIKQSDYTAFTGAKNYAAMTGVAAVAPSDIQQIVAVYVEERGGYTRTNESAEYNNMLSSKGIVVKLRLRAGGTVLCYLINNYDGAGTINWKEKNPACIR